MKNKTRIARIARLVALRKQQRSIKEAEHVHAQIVLDDANTQKDDCLSMCGRLDEEHDSTLTGEADPLDLDLISAARSRARHRLEEAKHEVLRASEEADAAHVVLLDAYRTHRSLEMFHDRIRETFRKDIIRSEQAESDDLSQRIIGTRRPF